MNAIKYTEEGTVEVRVAGEGGSQFIAISDTGRGIPPEARERIFQPFEQLEPIHQKHTPGIGLGLTLVRELAAALKVRLELESEVGAGSTFRVHFTRQAS